jgi:hypothetical protein
LRKGADAGAIPAVDGARTVVGPDPYPPHTRAAAGRGPNRFQRWPGGALAEQRSISARVTLRAAGGNVRWGADLARLSDTPAPETRTIGAIVVFEAPYAGVVPEQRLPLVTGLFVEAKT